MTTNPPIIDIVKSAINCIPNEPLFTGYANSPRATASLSTDPKTEPHGDYDNRSWSAADLRACNDLEASIVLGQLRYWWPKRHSRHRGVKKSYADWKDELGISKEKVQRINDVLVKSGLVEIYFDTWGHFKSKATFYVLTSKAHAVKPLAGNSPMPSSIAQVGNSPMVGKAQVGNSPITENTKDTENTKSKTTSVPQKPGTTGTPLNATKGTEAKQNQTPAKTQPPSPPVPVGEPIPDTYLGTPSKIVAWFREKWMAKYPGVPFVMPSEAVCKNFGYAMNVKVRKAGIDPTAFVAWVFSGYSKLCMPLDLNMHVDMQQVTLNVQEIVIRYVEAHKDKTAEVAAHNDAIHAKHHAPVVKAAAPAVVEDKPSPEEIAATLAHFQQVAKTAQTPKASQPLAAATEQVAVATEEAGMSEGSQSATQPATGPLIASMEVSYGEPSEQQKFLDRIRREALAAVAEAKAPAKGKKPVMPVKHHLHSCN